MPVKISILTDNHAGGHTAAEHGLSYLVEYDGRKLLFDAGQSDLFLKNAAIMQADIAGLDTIVLSHGHFDHGNGLPHLPGGHVVCHRGCFVRRYRKADHTYIGLQHAGITIRRKFEVTAVDTPHPLSDNIIFLGSIPRLTGFESRTTPFVFEDGTPDFVADDSALAIRTPRGLFVITGCGHAGVVNTLEHARKVTGEERLYGIMGGFHLKAYDLQTRHTIAYLKENNVSCVYPAHCTALPALAAFQRSFNIRQVCTGDVLMF